MENLFKKSIFSDLVTFNEFIDKSDAKSYKKLDKDPAWKLYASMDKLYLQKIRQELSKIETQII